METSAQTSKKKRIRPATAENYRRYLKILVAHFGEMKAPDITLDDVEDYQSDRASTPAGTNRQLELLSRVFSWAREQRYFRPFVTHNPVKGLKALPELSLNRFMKRPELTAVLKAANTLTPRWRDALWWLALHGCRPSDVYLRGPKGRGVRWDDVDLDALEWNLPVTKTEPRVLPLTDAAHRVLTRVRQYNTDELVFRLRWDALGAAVRNSTKLQFSPKDLRTTAATEMQRLGVPPDIIDRVQGRQPYGPAVRERYQKYAYLDEQRDALEGWQAMLLALAAEPEV